jgi:transcriptional regulator with XRE-family HTH domain
MGPVQERETTPGRVVSGVPWRFRPSAVAGPRPDRANGGERRTKASDRRRTLGRLVAARRAELGLTQKDLGVRMGVSRTTVARLEGDQLPSTETLKRLVRALAPEHGDVLLRTIESELDRRGVVVPRPTSPPVIPRQEWAPWGSVPGRRVWAGPGVLVLIALMAIVTGLSYGNREDNAPKPTELASAPPAAAPVALMPEGKLPKSGGDKPLPKSGGDNPTRPDEGGGEASVDGMDVPVVARQEPSRGESSAAPEPASSLTRLSGGFQSGLVNTPAKPQPAHGAGPTASSSDSSNESTPNGSPPNESTPRRLLGLLSPGA